MIPLNRSIAKYNDRSVQNHRAVLGNSPINTPEKHIQIDENTGPLDVVIGKTVLVIADIENLTISAKKLGYQILYEVLAEKLSSFANSCVLHAFYSCPKDDNTQTRYFSTCGWNPHPRDIQLVMTYRGVELLANSDNQILFAAGLIISRSRADVIEKKEQRYNLYYIPYLACRNYLSSSLSNSPGIRLILIRKPILL